MEHLLLGEFWREVGLTVAARLSVVIVALWAVKMVTDHLKVSGSTVPRAAQTLRPAPAENQRAPETVTPEHRGGLIPTGGGRRLSIKKPQADPWRTKMGKYLSGEPAVTSKAPQAANVR